MKRRDFLNQMSYLGLGLVSYGCHLLEDSEMAVGQSNELKEGDYWIRMFNGDDILIKRNSRGQIECFSLICSHKQCTVKWEPEIQQFLCPCHKGRYDANGNVVSGKPPKPLTKFKLEERNGILFVLNEKK
ncbi:MAG: Rieske (2Fe-2S) protein [Bacteroidia bacterium]|nr:Rieske (2Fe-2S) protein [Bacteroidia bacterium]